MPVSDGTQTGNPSFAQWITLVSSALPALAAVIALAFTWVSVDQVGDELRISQQGQITDRFNAAIEHLGSDKLDIRLGGIYALQRIMKDSPEDQSTVVQVLAAYIRGHAPAKNSSQEAKEIPCPLSPFEEDKVLRSEPNFKPPATDIQTALAVLTQRDRSRDRNLRVDLRSTDLRAADFQHFDLGDFLLGGADLRGADLSNARLSGADLTSANLTSATLDHTDLHAANLESAELSRSSLNDADLRGTKLQSANFRHATMVKVNLSGVGRIEDEPAEFSCAYMRGANLSGSNITSVMWHVDLTNADLSRANLTASDLTSAILTRAKLNQAVLSGVTLIRAKLNHADLTSADLKSIPGGAITDLTRADLTSANLSSADFTGSVLSHTILNDVRLGKNTKIKMP
ncbi:pentapeptide repeat-containing protein [Streptomyces sp. NRRL S-1448]|uniref:pentapeptide repeat-containing protein n=1 Tax=Streptomyces sp. NRRL S-1448 TaxID=1463883 RepID=UPI00131BD0BF|nr:pentapeptide repeat-containing protein [Streptomyces sp. NRRL S-1448]